VTITTNLGQTGKQYQYVPTLRTKAGESTALNHLSPGDKRRIVPILQHLPNPAAGFSRAFGSAWAGLPAIIDGLPELSASGTSTAFLALAANLLSQGVHLVPLIDVGATGVVASAVGQVQNQIGGALVLRAKLNQLALVLFWLQQFGGHPAGTDLVIDCGHIADIDPALMLQTVVANLPPHLTAIRSFRSATLSSSAAPKDATNLQTGPNLIPRLDWLLWASVAQTFPFLHFGDYGIVHRDLTEPPGYAMANATVTPRYTLDREWLILKGTSTRGAKGQPMTAQYHRHAQHLVRHPSFDRLPSCWGDGEIQRIAALAGVGGAGGRAQWVGFGLSRHLCLVANRLP
jgi:hypothetical protein